jgi:tRNA threonylcarbamoyladenosine biosynthesis protein TsaE
MNIKLLSSCVEDTLEIARELGAVLLRGDVVALTGDLGAGKTVFCKGVGEALGIPADRIVSPSFTILTEHGSARPGSLPLYHADLYRLSGEREAEEIGLEEALYGDGICLVEWAEKIASILPKCCINVKFSILDESGRTLIVTAEDSPRMSEFAASCKRYTPGG